MRKVKQWFALGVLITIFFPIKLICVIMDLLNDGAGWLEEKTTKATDKLCWWADRD